MPNLAYFARAKYTNVCFRVQEVRRRDWACLEFEKVVKK